MNTREITLRDPYVLPRGGKYYLYGARSETCRGEAVIERRVVGAGTVTL